LILSRCEEFLADFTHAAMLFIKRTFLSKFAFLTHHAQAEDDQHQRRDDDSHQKQDNSTAMTALEHKENLKIQGRKLLYSPCDGFMSGNCHGNANNFADSYACPRQFVLSAPRLRAL